MQSQADDCGGPVRPIRSLADYEAAIARIDRLWGAPDGSAACDERAVLTVLVDAWEEETWPIAAPDPVSAILAVMEDSGLSRRDPEPI